MTAKSGRLSDLYIASLPSVAIVAEATTELAAGVSGAPAIRQFYQITNAARRRLDKTTAVTVERSTGGGYTVVPATEYVINPVQGIVEFVAQQAVSTVIRVNASYLPMTKLGGAREWSMEIGNGVEGAPEFGDGWTAKVQTIKEGSASLSRWWMDAAFLGYITAGHPLVVILHADYAAGQRYEAYARIASDSIDTAVDGLVDESLDLEFDGRAYYVNS